MEAISPSAAAPGAPAGGDAPGVPPAATPTPGPVRSRRWRRIRSTLLLLVGLGLFAWLLVHADPAAVWERLRMLGWWSPLVLVPYLFIATFDTQAWALTLPEGDRRRVPFHAFYGIRMAGEAVNSVTPTAAVGGEPLKAWMLRPWGVSGHDGMASVVIAKTALVAAQSVFTAIGVAAFLWWLGHTIVAGLWMGLLVLASALFTILLVWLQRRNPAAAAWRLLRRLFPRAAFVGRLEHGVVALDRRLADFYAMEPHGFLQASALNFVAWLLGVVETQVMLSLVDHPTTWLDALIIETLAQPIRAAAIVVPGGIGTQEVGGVWLCTYLGMPEPVAVTLWVLKRVREMAFDGVGLVYLWATKAR